MALLLSVSNKATVLAIILQLCFFQAAMCSRLDLYLFCQCTARLLLSLFLISLPSTFNLGGQDRQTNASLIDSIITQTRTGSFNTYYWDEAYAACTDTMCMHAQVHQNRIMQHIDTDIPHEHAHDLKYSHAHVRKCTL